MSKIIEHHANGKRWLIVEVPEGATDISLDAGCRLRYMDAEECVVMLPLGNYRLHCVAGKATGSQAHVLLEGGKHPALYKDYLNDSEGILINTEALKNLITHHFGQTDNKHVILEIL